MQTVLDNSFLHPFYFIDKAHKQYSGQFFESRIKSHKRTRSNMNTSMNSNFSRSTNVSPSTSSRSGNTQNDQQVANDEMRFIEMRRQEKETLRVKSTALPSLTNNSNLVSLRLKSRLGIEDCSISGTSTNESESLPQKQQIADNSEHSRILIKRRANSTQRIRKLRREVIEKRGLDQLYMEQYEEFLIPYYQIYTKKYNKLNTFDNPDEVVIENFLESHDVTVHYRQKMVDWMLMVIQSFGKSSDRTYFVAVNLLDQVFLSKRAQNVKLNKFDLHLYGLTALFIASKMEDYSPITLSQIVNDAAHKKFGPEQIVQAEKDIMTSLNFKLHSENAYDVAFIQLKEFLKHTGYDRKLSPEDLQLIHGFLAFVLHISLYKISFCCIPVSMLSRCAILITFKLLNMLKTPSAVQAHLNQSSSQDSNIFEELRQKFKQVMKFSDLEKRLIFPKLEQFSNQVLKGDFEFKSTNEKYSQLLSTLQKNLNQCKSPNQ